MNSTDLAALERKYFKTARKCWRCYYREGIDGAGDRRLAILVCSKHKALEDRLIGALMSLGEHRDLEEPEVRAMLSKRGGGDDGLDDA